MTHNTCSSRTTTLVLATIIVAIGCPLSCVATAADDAADHPHADALSAKNNPLEPSATPSVDPIRDKKRRQQTAELQEVLVTARKFTENLQNVPDAITAFTPITI